MKGKTKERTKTIKEDKMKMCADKELKMQKEVMYNYMKRFNLIWSLKMSIKFELGKDTSKEIENLNNSITVSKVVRL